MKQGGAELSHTKRSIIALFLLGAFSGQVTAAKAQCPESAYKFWKSFRQTVLRGDKQKVADYVHFPFEIRGALDSSERRKMNREEFVTKFTKLTTTDPGLSAEPSTMINLVQSTPRLAPGSCSQAGDEFRVGAWGFELNPQGWHFVRAYLEH